MENKDQLAQLGRKENQETRVSKVLMVHLVTKVIPAHLGLQEYQEFKELK